MREAPLLAGRTHATSGRKTAAAPGRKVCGGSWWCTDPTI